jgi:hypothetical protein
MYCTNDDADDDDGKTQLHQIENLSVKNICLHLISFYIKNGSKVKFARNLVCAEESCSQ